MGRLTLTTGLPAKYFQRFPNEDSTHERCMRVFGFLCIDHTEFCIMPQTWKSKRTTPCSPDMEIGKIPDFRGTSVPKVCTRNPLCVFRVHGRSRLKLAVIPDGVEVIGPSAFHDCEFLERVVIPDSVKFICRIAFLRCRRLISLSLPHGLHSVQYFAFAGCTELKSVTFRPPPNRPKQVFIAWAISVGNNRNNFESTNIARMRNVVALIVILASESRPSRSIVGGRKGLALTFAGCAKLIDKFGMSCRDETSLSLRAYCDPFFNAEVYSKFTVTSSKRKAQTPAKLQDNEHHPLSTKKVHVSCHVYVCVRV